MVHDKLIDWQLRQGPLGGLHKCFYRCRDLLVEKAFPDHDNDPLPLISLEADAGSWRGKFQSVGPFGLPNVITINVRRFKLASDTAETFAHEMCHWFVNDSSSGDVHGPEWRRCMKNRLGLPVADDGEPLPSTERWWALEWELVSMGLERYKLSA